MYISIVSTAQSVVCRRLTNECDYGVDQNIIFIKWKVEDEKKKKKIR